MLGKAQTRCPRHQKRKPDNMPITNLSSNNTPAAIERYRQNYDRAFAPPTTTDQSASDETPEIEEELER